MDQISLHATEERCTEEHMPKCQSGCPLHMDVRAFMAFMSDDSINEARKIIERHLPLPSIMAEICDHPCENHCLRRDFGGSLAIQSLESYCMKNSQKTGRGFLRPPKAKKTAVLGNGLSGFVVAYELAKKSWPVTIFYDANEDDTQVYSFLLQQFPTLSLEIVQEECANLERQHTKFTQAKLNQDLLQSLSDEYAAFYIDAHAAPKIFSSLGKPPNEFTAHIHDNICAGGMLNESPTGSLYASSSMQAGQGRAAALSLERILGGINVDAGRDEQNKKDKLYTDLSDIKIVEAIIPNSLGYDATQAKLEAARCIQCQCMQCVKKCVYLQKYGSFPRSYTRQIYNNAAIVQGERRANSLVNGCMLCGQCTEICPERFSMAEVCLQAREDMVTRKYMPASAHAFALNDLQAATDQYSTLFMAASTSTNYAFFPGCQLTAARGDQVGLVYEFLCEHMSNEVGLILSCCGTPATWAGEKKLAKEKANFLNNQWEKLDKPTLILACASCKQFFTNMLPHIKTISLWEVLCELHEYLSTDNSNSNTSTTYTIHDPCSARNDQEWLKSTRLLAKHCNVICEDSNQAKTITNCCGYGGLVWCAQPELANKATEEMAKNLRQNTGLASCIMCRDRLVSSKKDCMHFFDILPFIKNAELAYSANNHPQSLSAKRTNRIKLVEYIQKKYDIAHMLPKQPSNEICEYALSNINHIHGHEFLHINADLLSKLEQKHILHQDVAEAVLHVEDHEQRFMEKESGHYVGAWNSKTVTFWVRYSKDESNKYYLHDAWCHRMFVPNTDPKQTRQ